MTSQPLETIPEEPTPTPAPARVTADPPKTKPAKNPGRLASGKRLAERNRLARKPRRRQKQSLLALRQPQPRLVLVTSQQKSVETAASL